MESFYTPRLNNETLIIVSNEQTQYTSIFATVNILDNIVDNQRSLIIYIHWCIYSTKTDSEGDDRNFRIVDRAIVLSKYRHSAPTPSPSSSPASASAANTCPKMSLVTLASRIDEPPTEHRSRSPNTRTRRINGLEMEVESSKKSGESRRWWGRVRSTKRRSPPWGRQRKGAKEGREAGEHSSLGECGYVMIFPGRCFLVVVSKQRATSANWVWA